MMSKREQDGVVQLKGGDSVTSTALKWFGAFSAAVSIGNFQAEVVPALIRWGDFFLNVFSAVGAAARLVFAPVKAALQLIAGLTGWHIPFPDSLANMFLMNLVFGLIVVRSAILREVKEDLAMIQFSALHDERTRRLEAVQFAGKELRRVEEEIRRFPRVASLSAVRREVEVAKRRATDAEQKLSGIRERLGSLRTETSTIPDMVWVEYPWYERLFGGPPRKLVPNPELGRAKHLLRQLERDAAALKSELHELGIESQRAQRTLEEAEQKEQADLSRQRGEFGIELGEAEEHLRRLSNKDIPEEKRGWVAKESWTVLVGHWRWTLPVATLAALLGPILNVYFLFRTSSGVLPVFYLASVFTVTLGIWVGSGTSMALFAYGAVGYLCFLGFVAYDAFIDGGELRKDRDFWESLLWGPIIFLIMVFINWQFLPGE